MTHNPIISPKPDVARAMQKSYLIGFVLAIILTVIPFWLVYSKTQSAGGGLSLDTIYGVIAGCAVLQVLVHLKFFLNMGFEGDNREKTIWLAITAFLVLIMLGGSFWIMADLSDRMMNFMKH